MFGQKLVVAAANYTDLFVVERPGYLVLCMFLPQFIIVAIVSPHHKHVYLMIIIVINLLLFF